MSLALNNDGPNDTGKLMSWVINTMDITNNTIILSRELDIAQLSLNRGGNLKQVFFRNIVFLGVSSNIFFGYMNS